MRQICVVKYQIATYRGEETVFCDSNDEDENIIAVAKRQLRKRVGSLPLGYEFYRVVSRDPYIAY